MANNQAVAEPTSAPAGRVAAFGKYLLLQRVSVGGMAEVFKALPQGATRIDQIIAIKRILPNIAEDSEFIGMFIDEARIAGQLTHPNICRIYELGRVANDHYIAMQFLWGRDLLKVMNRFKKAAQPIPPPMAAFIAARASAALHYAHFKHDQNGQPLNIIHRDVSPQNIIVGYSGQVKLIDFGVARAASQSQKTQAGILKGKFGYMSPEMIRGLPVDHRSDVFAMGICLHEALTGSRLFYGETDFATLELVRDARVMPPSAKEPGVPPALDAIVLKALSRDANQRYQTAQELEAALDHFIETHYPGYGQDDVGNMMRQAFAQEVTREKARLELFSEMLARGELVRGAPIPALPGDPPPSEPAPAKPRPTRREGLALDITIDEPIDEGIESPIEDVVEDERTQIFFSAEELDEIRELESEPSIAQALPDQQPTAADVMMGGGLWPPSPVHDTGDPFRPATSSGTYNKVQRHGHPLAHDERRVATLDLDPYSAEARRSQKRKGTLRYIMLALVAVVLVVGGYAAARLLVPRTGTIEVAAVGDPGALVRVDGVLRGNPPLIVEDLREGVHHLEIEAKGYEIARQEVYVRGGTVTPVSVVLERSLRPEVARIQPVVEQKAETPATTSSPAPAEKATAAKKRPASKTSASTSSTTPASPSASATQSAQATSTQPNDGMGELLISTLPWSHVFIDGKDTGRDTPVRNLRVPEGPHRVGLRTPDGVMHYVDVFVEAGQTVRIIRRF